MHIYRFSCQNVARDFQIFVPTGYIRRLLLKCPTPSQFLPLNTYIQIFFKKCPPSGRIYGKISQSVSAFFTFFLKSALQSIHTYKFPKMLQAKFKFSASTGYIQLFLPKCLTENHPIAYIPHYSQKCRDYFLSTAYIPGFSEKCRNFFYFSCNKSLKKVVYTY